MSERTLLDAVEPMERASLFLIWSSRSLDRACGESDPLQALLAVSEANRDRRSAEMALVQACLNEGASWAAIGAALGVTRQSAWERFRDLTHQT